MMELSGGIGEPTPCTEPEAKCDFKDSNSDDVDPLALDLDIKEEPLEIKCDFKDSNSDDLDPLALDLDVKEEPLIAVKMEDLVTSSQNESVEVLNDLGIESFISNTDENQVVVSSSDDNGPVDSAGNGSVLPTGLLLYKLFNQIIIDALLGSPKGNESLSMWDNSSLNVMANTQNWINKQNFSKGRYSIKKTLKKAGSTGNLIIEKGKLDVTDHSKNDAENFSLVSNSDVALSKKCDYCDRFSNRAVSKNGSINTNDESKIICSVCDINRQVSNLNCKRELRHKNVKDALSKENNNVVTNHPNNNFHSDVIHCDNASNKNKIIAERNLTNDLVIVDSFSNIRNEFKECSVVLNKVEFHDEFYVCSTCDKIFYDLNYFNNHKRLICSKKDGSNSSQKVVGHSRDICKLFAGDTSATYKNHVESHSLEAADVSLNLSCKYCDKITNSQSELISHLASHDRNYKFFCDKCDKKFNKLNLYKIHYKKIHGFVKDNNKFLCNYKKNSADKYNVLKRKTLRCDKYNLKRFVCNICDKSFSRALTMESHINKEHVRSKRFDCSNCEKSFTRRSSLLSHTKLIHDGLYNEVFVKI